jgi:hypothetical protein
VRGGAARPRRGREASACFARLLGLRPEAESGAKENCRVGVGRKQCKGARVSGRRTGNRQVGEGERNSVEGWGGEVESRETHVVRHRVK